jgi:hypothetical protein
MLRDHETWILDAGLADTQSSRATLRTRLTARVFARRPQWQEPENARTGCSSTRLGATPVCPCLKSKNSTRVFAPSR